MKNIRDQIRNPTRDPVSRQVWSPVRRKVWSQVWCPVMAAQELVENQVRIEILNQTKG
jgi:hypothetical protein